MDSNRGRFTLRVITLSSAVWYATVLVGWALFAGACYQLATTPVDRLAPFVMTAMMIVLLELLPLVQGRGHDPQGVVMSTAFVFAMLFVWGVWPAVIMVVIAAVAADLRVKKEWWKVAFNGAQYAVSVGCGYLVMLAAGHTPSLDHPLEHFGFADMTWVVGVWIVYFFVNLLSVAAVVSYNRPFRSVVSDDFVHYTAMSFSVFSLSPLIVVGALAAWQLLPLLMIPLLLLYYTAHMSLEREHEAAHDSLTGLPNRITLQFTLEQALANSRHSGVPFGLMLIDLDDFKRVNDTLGHQVGDDLLSNFADRLRRSVRPGDHVSRLGGDEFAVVVVDADEAEVCQVAERLRASMIDPFEVGGLLLEVELSVGIAVCPQHGTDGDTLLRRADVAMYMAKESRAGIETYSSDRDHNSADRLSLLGELRQALDDDAFELHFQPKLSTRDASTLGVEALLRWRHPERGYVAPDSFIPLAERSGLMHLLTERVITLALNQMATWRDLGMYLPVAVNISPTDLVGGRLVPVVTAGLRRHNLPAGMLQLEITERMVAQHIEEAAQVLSQLREVGVRISLDDFGTGYSSLVRLHSLPVDEIKIDRVFVSTMASGPAAIGIIQAVIDLAHALGLPAVAEGVETQEEWRLLDSLGCDGVQGWYVAMPMPAEQATQWIRGRQSVGTPPARLSPSTAAGASAESKAVRALVTRDRAI
jgi:diguanylate cyclase (GGDEF)-like protein